MKLALLCGAVAAIGASPIAYAETSATPRSLSVSFGYDFSQSDSDIGSDDTINVVTLGTRLAIGDWSLGLSSGYVDLSDNPDSVFVGLRGQEFEVTSGEASSGFTDLVLSLGYTLAHETDGRPGVFLSSAVKLPTADEEAGLSSGAADLTGSVELFKSFSSVTAYIYAGGRIRGDSDEETAARRFRFQPDRDGVETDADAPQQQDSFEGGLGLQFPLGSKWSGSMGYDYRGPSFDGGDEAHELTVLVSLSATSSTTLSAYVYQGLANSEAPLGGGVYVSHKFLRW